VLAALLAAFPSISPARTIIHAMALIDGLGDAPREKVSIVVEDGRFAQVVDGYIPAGEGDELASMGQ
jgi:hypothetical protein